MGSDQGRRTYELSPFLGEPQPIELVARLESIRVEGSTALLGCATARREPELEEHWGTTAVRATASSSRS